MANIIFDFDGVLVRSRLPDKTFLWQQTIEPDLGLNKTLRDQIFVQPGWNEIICGKSDFRIKLGSIFSQSSNLNPDTFIEYWLAKDLNWHLSVLDFASELKAKGHNLYIGTNQDRIRTDFIRKQLEIRDIFTEMFPSCELGICKPSPHFYSEIVKRLSKADYHDLIVVDDDQRNIDAAKTCGLEGVYFNPDLETTHTVDFLRLSLAAAMGKSSP